MTLERQIAGKALKLVTAQIQPTQGHEEESKYLALCEGFPILLRTAGLAQTVTYLLAKKKKREYFALYSDLQTQLRDLHFVAEGTLVEKCTDAAMPLAEYRMLSEITMVVALWQKRMAQALLRKKGD